MKNRQRILVVFFAILSFILFGILPLIAEQYTTFVELENHKNIYLFLSLTSSVLCFQVMMFSVATKYFDLAEYGFGLSINALSCIIAMIGIDNLKTKSMDILGRQIDLQTAIFIGFSLSLLLTGVALFVCNSLKSAKNEDDSLKPFWRLTNYCIGVISMEIFIIVKLAHLGAKWNF